MPHVETHAPGDFCWIELATTDQSAAKEFYSELFGWTIGEFNKPDSRHGPTRQSHQIGNDKRACVYKIDQLPDGPLGSSPETTFAEMIIRTTLDGTSLPRSQALAA